MKLPIALIVATDENNGIGKADGLPWHLPSEMGYFMRTTKHHVVIMGRKSFEAIGEPLKDRYNIVLTTDLNYEKEGVLVVSSLEEALFFGKLVVAQDGSPYNNDLIFITGGGKIYEQALDAGMITHLYYTKVHAVFECDTYFPNINWDDWQVIQQDFHPKDEKNPYDYTIYVYEKK